MATQQSASDSEQGSSACNKSTKTLLDVGARLFTENDELVLLKGIIDFKDRNGVDPSSDMASFHTSIQDSLSRHFNRKQIVGKISKLKTKFMKKGQIAQDSVLFKPHDCKLFELWDNIWGRTAHSRLRKDDNVGGKTPAPNQDTDIQEQTKAVTADCWSLYPSLCASVESEAIKYLTAPIIPKEYVKKVISGLDRDKARELEEGWKGFVLMEQEVYAKRAKLIFKQAEAAINPSSHGGVR